MAREPATERVRRAVERAGLAARIVEFGGSTRTAEDAARAIGCQVGQIVKSLVFVAGGEPLLLLVSGANLVDLDRLEALAGRKVRRADAQEVRRYTGFAIGGVPPAGHDRRLRVLMDPDLLGYEEVWAAAGTPKAVFSLPPRDLQRLARAEVVALKEG